MSKTPTPDEKKPTIDASDAPQIIPLIIGNERRETQLQHEVRDPYRGDIVAYAPVSSKSDCDAALEAAYRAKVTMGAMPGHERAALLRRAAQNVEAIAEQAARAMTRESGKALKDSLTEVRRSADTLRLFAEEAVRIQGEHIPMDATAISAGKLGMLLRFPVGVVAAITPFNAPVNLTAHKLGPALAAGNSIVLKPSPKAPLSFHLFVEAVAAAGFPAGTINTVYGDEAAAQIVKDPRVDFVSFTGSVAVGKLIRNSVGMKRVTLELGGIGPTFVHRDADMEAAARACARNAVAVTGQSCVSVQNVFVHQDLYAVFTDAVCRELDTIRFGDPMDMNTDVGTLIDEAAAIRVQTMIDDAISQGAEPLRGGARRGAQLPGTVLVNTKENMDVIGKEIFGPAMSIQPYRDIEPHFAAISESPYGLQCGIFTNSLDLALSAVRNIRTGGVIVNGTSRWRSDQMPYGGVKDSGMGREGSRYSTQDMTEERFVVFN